MAKNKTYKCLVGIELGKDRKFRRGQTISSSNVKKDTISGLLAKGYIEEFNPAVVEEPKAVTVKTKEVDTTKGDGGKADEIKDDEETDDDIKLEIDPDDVVE